MEEWEVDAALVCRGCRGWRVLDLYGEGRDGVETGSTNGAEWNLEERRASPGRGRQMTGGMIRGIARGLSDGSVWERVG